MRESDRKYYERVYEAVTETDCIHKYAVDIPLPSYESSILDLMDSECDNCSDGGSDYSTSLDIDIPDIVDVANLSKDYSDMTSGEATTDNNSINDQKTEFINISDISSVDNVKDVILQNLKCNDPIEDPTKTDKDCNGSYYQENINNTPMEDSVEPLLLHKTPSKQEDDRRYKIECGTQFTDEKDNILKAVKSEYCKLTCDLSEMPTYDDMKKKMEDISSYIIKSKKNMENIKKVIYILEHNITNYSNMDGDFLLQSERNLQEIIEIISQKSLLLKEEYNNIVEILSILRYFTAMKEIRKTNISNIEKDKQDGEEIVLQLKKEMRNIHSRLPHFTQRIEENNRREKEIRMEIDKVLKMTVDLNSRGVNISSISDGVIYLFELFEELKASILSTSSEDGHYHESINKSKIIEDSIANMKKVNDEKNSIIKTTHEELSVIDSILGLCVEYTDYLKIKTGGDVK